MEIPRVLNDVLALEGTTNELHGFCDASSKAYAASVYLRSTSPSAKVRCSLIFAMVRLAPIKRISLPGLELMVNVIAARLTSFVKKELQICINRAVIWIDSKCVLHWLRSTKVLPVFVANRIKEIKSFAGLEFRYVPTACNSADIPSRGVTLKELKESALWWNGPSYLLMSESQWLENELPQIENSAPEFDNPQPMMLNIAVPVEGIGNIIDVNSMPEKAIKEFQSVCRIDRSSRKFMGTLHPVSVVSYLVLRRETPKIQRKPLGTFLDKTGTIRCSGRIPTFETEDEHPKLLPKNNRFTDLVIECCHRKLIHAGVRQTLAQIRFNYWIPQGKSQVQKVLKACLTCRKVEGGPFKVPDSPPLPWFRASPSCPFKYVRVDYLGQLFIKAYDDGPCTVKVWICLYTCAAVRAIHLEVVQNLSTAEFLTSLRRFMALYGAPQIIVSDNGTQFKAANAFIQLLFKSQDIQNFVSTEGITWKFIPEASLWMGGFCERMVRSVKRSFRKCSGKGCLTLAQLQTITAEVTAIANSRPLVGTDYDIGEEALTPAHFLGKGGGIGLPEFQESDQCILPSNIHQRGLEMIEHWKKGQNLLNQFWKSWRNEYLMSLTERQSFGLSARSSSQSLPKVGAVVLIKDDLPRSRWKVGRIISTNSSSDRWFLSFSIGRPTNRKEDNQAYQTSVSD